MQKIEIDREACLRAAQREGDSEVGAGALAADPQAANTDTRTCTCHPSDFPPKPCPRKFALTECRVAALIAAATPFAAHDWTDAELEDDNCKLTRHSGSITVGDWRRLRIAINDLASWR